MNNVFGFAANMKIRIGLALGLAFALAFAMAPVQAFAAIERSIYIVQIQPGTDIEVRKAIASMGETPLDQLDYVLDGFTLSLTALEAEQLALNPAVISVAPDEAMSLFDIDTPTKSWGLDRLDQFNTTFDQSFTYPSSAGAGVRIYIADTGVQANHPDLAGRVLPGFDTFGQGLSATDCHGHGTHVSGTAAGTQFGVAKQALIVPVRVLGCSGSGSYSGLITALDWIVANHPAGTPGIVSMSLGGPKSLAVNAALERVTAAGILTVVAAGNSNADACQVSPASTANAITVGASTNTDARASFSNWGECTDIFAPGAAITSDNAKDFSAPLTWNGTSMATPHVSGAAALYLAKNPTATPAQVTAVLKQNGQAGVISNSLTPNGNILLNTSFLNSAESAPIVGVPTAPATPVASSIGKDSFALNWVAPADNGSPIVGYKVEFRSAATATWSSLSTTETFAQIAGLEPSTGYQARVSAVNAVGASAPSPTIVLTTLGLPPSTPTGLAVYSNWGTGTQFTWVPVASSGVNPIKGYRLELLRGETWINSTFTTSRWGVIAGLQPLTDYTMRLFAVNAAGDSAPTAPFNFKTSTAPPATVTGLAVSTISATTAKVSWSEVARVVDSIPITYEVTFGKTGSNTLLGTFNTAELSQSLSGLSVKTSYWVKVRAISLQTNGSQATASFSTPANAPSKPYFNMSGRKGDLYHLEWAVASSGGEPITGYLLQRLEGSNWVDVADQTATWLDVSMPPRATSVTYRVFARNSVGLSEPSSNYVFATPADRVSAPGSLAISSQSLTTISLSWSKPTDDGGAPVLGYQVLGSSDNGTTWRALASLGATTLTFSTVAPPKGTAMLYKVAARNSSGFGLYSEVLKAETPLTVASKPLSVSLSLAADNAVSITWRAPFDFGGTPITGYLIQKLDGANWVDLASVSSSTFSFGSERLAMGKIMTIRVIAQNAIGASEPTQSPNLLMPYGKADSPTGLAADTNLTTLRTTLTWAHPAATGGSPISSFNVQYSIDNGNTWRGLLTAGATATTISFAAPTKGVATLYRVSANTLGGAGVPSAGVLVSLAKSAPSAPQSLYTKFAADANIVLTWSAPGDTGGSPITAYRVETLVDGVWQPLGGDLGRTINIARGLPGQVHQLRVTAVNEIGASVPSLIAKVSIPLVKASEPTELTADLTTKPGSVVLAWKAPNYLGGATAVTNYLVEYSDNSLTWSRTYATAASVTLPAPPKGVTRAYRVSANTLAGASAVSNTVTATTAATVASAPNLSSVTFASDGSVSVKFSKPYDLGGSPLTSYVVEKLVGSVWSSAATADPNATSATLVRESVGVLLIVRVIAKNAIGNSLPSRTLSLQMPFAQASAVQGVAIKAISTTRAQLSWAAPTNLGGGSVLRYNIEYSADNGATWRLYYTSTTTSYSVQAPPKGVTWLYRVSAQTQWGAGQGSVISYQW